jgi:hypothetical protein
MFGSTAYRPRKHILKQYFVISEYQKVFYKMSSISIGAFSISTGIIWQLIWSVIVRYLWDDCFEKIGEKTEEINQSSL